MKRFFALLAVALVLSPAARAEEGSEFWFNDGLAWYQHPCGFEAFVKYGKQDTPQIRHNYYLTLKHPEMCSTLFPSAGR